MRKHLKTNHTYKTHEYQLPNKEQHNRPYLLNRERHTKILQKLKATSLRNKHATLIPIYFSFAELADRREPPIKIQQKTAKYHHKRDNFFLSPCTYEQVYSKVRGC